MYIFGYGSLINADSIGRNLKREVSYSEMIPALISGYSRSWTASCIVEIIKESGIEKLNANFLDLSESNGFCNGTLFKVNEKELELLKKREIGYELISVLAKTETKEVEAFTFKVSNENKAADGVILTKYINIIEEALANLSKSFRKDYWNQLIAHNNKELPYDYKWLS